MMWSTFKKVLKAIGSLFLLLLGIAILRTLLIPNPSVVQYCNPEEEYYVSVKDNILKRFSQALKFRTVSYNPHDYERDAMSNFSSHIFKSFPLVHSSPIVSWEIVNNFSRLYYVRGTNKDLKPYMLAAHMDVVPVDETKWSVSPFDGIIDDKFVWGRGTLDCKHLVMGILEALEFLLSKNYQPQRSFYIAFGHDEEIHGLEGAKHISALLHSRNVKFEYILDEGSVVVKNLLPGVKDPIALVSVSEKGSLTLQLKVDLNPGHSSIPTKETAIVVLAKAVSKLEGDVFPSMFGTGPERQMFEELAFAAPFPLKVILSNIWLFKPLIVGFMSSPVMMAMHKTTTAVTIINGGTKINVLPSSASASVNFRIHPAQTIDEVKQYVKRLINDERVVISEVSSSKPHPVSPVDSFGYLTIKKSIRQMINDSWVVPCTLFANTDTRWYLGLSDSIYRFSLLHITLKDVSRVHGNDERIAIDNYMKIINFYVHLIKNSDEITLPKHVHAEL